LRSSARKYPGKNKTIKDLTDDVARLNRRVEAQNVEIKTLKSENKDLRERLLKYEDPQPPKNSGNSSVPPFYDRDNPDADTFLPILLHALNIRQLTATLTAVIGLDILCLIRLG